MLGQRRGPWRGAGWKPWAAFSRGACSEPRWAEGASPLACPTLSWVDVSRATRAPAYGVGSPGGPLVPSPAVVLDDLTLNFFSHVQDCTSPSLRVEFSRKRKGGRGWWICLGRLRNFLDRTGMGRGGADVRR